jgi:hypothetical protein
MAKLIQTCASENDLFGLDSDGTVSRYNFKTNSWMRLGGGRPGADDAASADGQPTIPQLEVAGDHRPEIEPPSRGDPHESAR